MNDEEFKLKIEKYREELIMLLHKSQDSFEKQLSYISAGSLALSMGFIKDVVGDIELTDCTWLLDVGWILLAATLLINCISHFIAAKMHNMTVAEINEAKYDPGLVVKRTRIISRFNFWTIVTMILGIVSIIIFVIKNI